jgi:formate dehydrogenase subunit beta
MALTAQIEVEDQDLLKALRAFAGKLLQQDDIGALLAPWRLPEKGTIMPTLLTDPQHLDGIDPLSPAYPINGAKVVSKLTRRPSGGKIAAFLRPCEIRAFFELVKLKQGSVEDLVIIGLDCLGAWGNRDYNGWAGADKDAATKEFYTHVLSDNEAALDGIEPTAACRSCEFPVAQGADITVGLYGVDVSKTMLLQSHSDAGDALLNMLDYPQAEVPSSREKAVDALIGRRTAVRDSMLAETRAATDSLEKLTSYLANCVNCYNCRVACPVCYCRECVFVTDVFDHEPTQYMRWAKAKGAVKIPTDTVLYHLTRMVHMSTACVGCGQCSNACPNDIPVMELFRSAAMGSQAAFEYEAGRSLEEKPPMAHFKEEEYLDVVGIDG